MAEANKLRAIGHSLAPVVTVGVRGMTDGVHGEVDRALTTHELIKIRIAAGDRFARSATIAAIAAAASAQVVGSIGRTALLYRANPEADPRLSNVARAGASTAPTPRPTARPAARGRAVRGAQPSGSRTRRRHQAS